MKVLRKISEKEKVARDKSWKLNNIIFASQGFLLMVLEITGMYFSIRLWLDGSMSAGTVVLVQIYLAGIFASVWELGRAVAQFYKALSMRRKWWRFLRKLPIFWIFPIRKLVR